MEQNDDDVLIYVSAENELLAQIKDAYEDVTTTASVKREEREKYTNLFVEKYAEQYGLPKERVYVTGSPMAEVLHENLKEIQGSNVHKRLGLEKGKYILLSAHRQYTA